MEGCARAGSGAAWSSTRGLLSQREVRRCADQKQKAGFRTAIWASSREHPAQETKKTARKGVRGLRRRSAWKTSREGNSQLCTTQLSNQGRCKLTTRLPSARVHGDFDSMLWYSDREMTRGDKSKLETKQVN